MPQSASRRRWRCVLGATALALMLAIGGLPEAQAQQTKPNIMATGRLFFVVPAQAVVAQWLETFKEFPPRQRPASFNLDEVMRKMVPAQ